MLNLVPLMLVAAMQSGGGLTIGDHFFGHAMGITDTVDLTLRPAKVPDCRTDEEIQKALAQKQAGEEMFCIVPKSALPAKPR